MHSFIYASLASQEEIAVLVNLSSLLSLFCSLTHGAAAVFENRVSAESAYGSTHVEVAHAQESFFVWLPGYIAHLQYIA